jgi:phytoene dehydrogenase-like protein
MQPPMASTSGNDPIVVVGGGLAGLATAAYLARDRAEVTVLERAANLGGRAQTTRAGDFHLNLGPHALYRSGEGVRVLADLGVKHHGGVPKAAGGCALDGGRIDVLPGGFVSLLTTGLFGLSGKLEAAALLSGVGRIDATEFDRTTVRQWSSTRVRHPDVRRLLEALARLATYANAPETMSAGLAIRQLQMAIASSVSYLDGGWQTLVDGLRACAEGHGVRIRTAAAVTALERAADGRVTRTRLRDGSLVPASAVVLALDAPAASVLLPDGPVRRYAAAATPVLAACLDVALARLPRPRVTFALGIDEPSYYSVHSAVARLGPDGAAMVHVARYLGDATPEPKLLEQQLEGVLDRLQPGWREAVVERRFLPHMAAASALPRAADGGLSGRPGPEVPEVPGLYVAGDWVGPDGWLADGALASARRAAALVRERARDRDAVAA